MNTLQRQKAIHIRMNFARRIRYPTIKHANKYGSARAQHYTTTDYTWQQCERLSSSGITPPHLSANCSVAMYPYEWQHTRQPKTNRRNVATCHGRYSYLLVLDVCKTSLEHYGAAAAELGRSRVKPCSDMAIIRGSVRLTAVFLQRVS